MTNRDRELAQIIQALSGATPRELARGLAVPEEGATYLEGTTVRALGQMFVETPSGLFIPARLGRPVEPLDLIKVYTTLEELIGAPTSLEELKAVLRSIPVSDVILFAAKWLGRIRQADSAAVVDREYVQMLPTELAQTATRLLARESDHRHLVSAQQLTVLACMALAISPVVPDRPLDRPQRDLALVLAPLAVGEFLGSEYREGAATAASEEALRREIVSNQIFHASRSETRVLARWFRTWHQLPTEDDSVPGEYLADLFQESTGANLLDVATTALVMWNAARNGSYKLLDSSVEVLGISQEKIDITLNAVAGTYQEVIEHIKNNPSSTWNVDVLRRYPALRWGDESTVVFDPAFLIDRVFGWLPYWDIRNHLGSDRKRLGKFENALRNYNERYALETLASMAGPERVFDEKALQAAYQGHRVKIADCAILYPDCWIVLDVSTHVTTRETAHGLAPGALAKDIQRLVVAKARQIQSTIDRLREDETRLTGHPRHERTFVPVVLATEGFPVNPITTEEIRVALRDEGLLTAPDTLPLQVLDLEEIEMVEGVQETGGPDLATILRAKLDSTMATTSLRDYLFSGHRREVAVPRRVQGLAYEATALIVDRVERKRSQ